MWVGWGGGGGVGEQQDLPLNMWEIHPINSTQHLQQLLFTSVNNVPQALQPLPADTTGHCAHRVKLCRVRGRGVTLLTLMPEVLHMLQRDELHNQPPLSARSKWPQVLMPEVMQCLRLDIHLQELPDTIERRLLQHI